MTQKKILFLSPVDYFKGGAERSLFDLVSNPDIKPILCAPAEGDILQKGRELNIECHILPFRSIHNIHRPFSFVKGLKAVKDILKTALELKALGKKQNATIVHSNGLKAHAINCVSYLLGGPKAVLHIRDIPYTKAEILVWKILRLLCNKMVLVSHACWPEEKLPSKVIVIHNGTPLIETKPKEISSDVLTFGFIGRIHPAKGLDLLIEWLSEARRAGLKANLSVRGEYSTDAPSYNQEIAALIEKHNLSEYIEFTGFIDNAQTLYDGIDIVVVPSKVPDPLPRSVMESMAGGIPVFGYPAGGIFEMIEDKKTGFLVKDIKSFKEATEFITSNPDAMKNMTEAAKIKIEKEFSIKNLYGELNKIYQEI